MNVSAYDNVSRSENLSKSSVLRKLNDLLNINIDFEVRIFCPFCVKSFIFKFYLFEHLRTSHDIFLNHNSNQILGFIKCFFCNAEFYGKHLLAKHVLHYHLKVIKSLLINKNTCKCYFCDGILNQENQSEVLAHFEEFHFLDFEEELSKMFSCDTTQEISMSASQLINCTIKDMHSHAEMGRGDACISGEAVCMKVRKHSNDSLIQDFDEASRINLYDFTDLKQQLENIKGIKSENQSVANSVNKSILSIHTKDVKSSTTACTSARRVLKFDIPFSSEEKENFLTKKKFSDLKKIHLKENNINYDYNKSNFFCKLNDTFYDEPQHASTPNSSCDRRYKNENKKKTILNCKSSFKSFVSVNNIDEFGFQCGKCQLLFKENWELVSHVKNNHKKFTLSAFQPYYHCAICNARFYKNYYLRKHHYLHINHIKNRNFNEN